MMIIGITGTLGAGKGTVVEYLVNKYHFIHFSVRAFLEKEIVARNMPVNRDSMVVVANDLRKTHSPSYIVDCLYQQANETDENCVIESIRTPGEVLLLRAKGDFFLLAVDANPEIRYKRIVERASETDHVSFDTFIQNEQREFSSIDPNKQNLKKCMEMADCRIMNDGTMKELFLNVEKSLPL